MPAAYVEAIKYALGDQVAALATLRGKLYDLEEAGRLGFFHEVVEPDDLMSTAIGYARCITPDCNTAYAMSKKALQDGVLRQIDERTVALDELLPQGMTDPGNRRPRTVADERSCKSKGDEAQPRGFQESLERLRRPRADTAGVGRPTCHWRSNCALSDLQDD